MRATIRRGSPDDCDQTAAIPGPAWRRTWVPSRPGGGSDPETGSSAATPSAFGREGERGAHLAADGVDGLAGHSPRKNCDFRRVQAGLGCRSVRIRDLVDADIFGHHEIAVGAEVGQSAQVCDADRDRVVIGGPQYLEPIARRGGAGTGHHSRGRRNQRSGSAQRPRPAPMAVGSLGHRHRTFRRGTPVTRSIRSIGLPMNLAMS